MIAGVRSLVSFLTGGMSMRIGRAGWGCASSWDEGVGGWAESLERVGVWIHGIHNRID